MDWFWHGVLLLVFTVPVIVLFAYAAWDVIRRPDTKVWVRALWLILFCVLPIVGPLIYLVIRPPGTTKAELAVARGDRSKLTTTEELTALADLHERGKLSDHEYELAKERAVGTDVGSIQPGSVRDQRGSQMF